VNIEPLSFDGAWVFRPPRYADARGSFSEWFRADLLADATGREFTVSQANHSISRRGVVRGVHFSDVPPGQAKYVYCVSGAILDVAVDLRTGSPTFGRHDTVTLAAENPAAVFISEGLGHAFCALTDDTSVAYLVSTPYDPAREHTVSALDADLGIAWPAGVGELTLSDKDRTAPTLASALDRGLLPSYESCRRLLSE
jgi:dTDP-4-dehydrorhamnose 3,5-epimerase